MILRQRLEIRNTKILKNIYILEMYALLVLSVDDISNQKILAMPSKFNI